MTELALDDALLRILASVCWGLVAIAVVMSVALWLTLLTLFTVSLAKFFWRAVNKTLLRGWK